MITKDDAKKVIDLLSTKYIDVPELKFNSDYQLLVAVILSAQCTDKRVNIVTAELFKRYDTAEKMAKISQSELERYIFSCGFYKNKAKNIIAMSKTLVGNYGGQVPEDFETLQSLPGVGRKTANVVTSVAFHKPAIAVDTHVFRVSNRIGLVSADNPYDTEMQLRALIDINDWSRTHHYLIYLGRDVCKAGKADCQNCILKDVCEKHL